MVDELEQKCEKAAQSHQELDMNDNIVNDTIQAGQGQGLWQGEPGQHSEQCRARANCDPRMVSFARKMSK